MRRREFITGLAGATVLPLAASAQQSERMRRVGVLMALAESDSEAQARLAAFTRGLGQAGWAVGSNIRIDTRWAAGRPDRFREAADELVKLAPDAILAGGSAAVMPLLQATRSVPIVFVEATDPVAAGFVATLMRPGGNVTGFARPDMPVTGDWLDVLRQVAANVKRVAVLGDSGSTAGRSQLAAIQSTAQALDIAVSPIDVREVAAIERAVMEFARSPGGVLVVISSPAALQHRDLIIKLAAQHKLPAIYGERRYPAAGGLLSVGPDLNEEYRLAAGSVDLILKGEKPSEMPVRASVKIQLVINNRTAKALGIVMPPPLLGRADEVIE